MCFYFCLISKHFIEYMDTFRHIDRDSSNEYNCSYNWKNNNNNGGCAELLCALFKDYITIERWQINISHGSLKIKGLGDVCSYANSDVQWRSANRTCICAPVAFHTQHKDIQWTLYVYAPTRIFFMFYNSIKIAIINLKYHNFYEL